MGRLNKIAKTIEKYEKIKKEVESMNKKIRLTISQKFDSKLYIFIWMLVVLLYNGIYCGFKVNCTVKTGNDPQKFLGNSP